MFDAQHGGAVEADLMRDMGIRFRDVPDTIGWDGLLTLFANAPEGSATWRAANEALGEYRSQAHVGVILADVYDLLAALHSSFARVNSKRPASVRRPRPYRRPWVDDGGARTIGSGAIPASKFLDWYYEGV
ncbi:hypothetical protein HLV35_07540 [Eggerthellaceae bacterium zg-997]|nr:hypothetical protein [Eggerthellaceae bacterium zg-997]